MALASRGLRDMDAGPERQAREELAAVRRQARRVHLRALAATLAYITVTLALP